MIDSNDGYKQKLGKVNVFCRIMSVILLVLLSGCGFFSKKETDQFNYLKGQHILVVIQGVNRNSDVIEDWTDYKRYTWRQCEPTGRFVVGVRKEGDYLKPEIVCCEIQFDTDRNNIILGYEGLSSCPIAKQLAKKKLSNH